MNEDYRWNPPFNEIFLWPPASPKSFPLPFGHTPRVSDSVAQLEYSRAFPWILMFVSGRGKKNKKGRKPSTKLMFDTALWWGGLVIARSGVPLRGCHQNCVESGLWQSASIFHALSKGMCTEKQTNKKRQGNIWKGLIYFFLTYSPGRTLEGQSDPGAGWIMGLWLPSSEAQTWSSDITFLGKAKKRLSSSRQGSRLAIYSGLRSWLFLVSRIQFSQFYASSLPK